MLLINLQDKARFPTQAVIDLYFRRWAVEVHYRDEKTSLDIETFHSQMENGIRQELFAILIMAVITLANEAARLTPQCPEVALAIQELLREIARVRYY